MNEASTTESAMRHQQWLVQLDAALRTQGLDAAGRLALQAVEDGVEHPAVLNLAASAHFNGDRLEEALSLLERAQAFAPNDPKLLNSMGICLKSLGRKQEARNAFDAALGIDPNMASAHFNRGVLLEGLKFTKAARSDYEQAAANDPNQLEAIARIAWLDAQSGDAASARTQAERVLARSPSNAVARMALSFADLQEGELDAALARLTALSQEPGLDEENRTIVTGLVGDAYDAKGQPKEAFAAYAACSAQLKARSRARFEGPGRETALQHARRLNAWFEATNREIWRQAPPAQITADDPRAHIFLVGFPRSGTTLLENVLASHPEVTSLEEKDCLATVSDAYLSTDQGLGRLAAIGPEDARRDREAYWSRARDYGVDPRGRVFVDKMPLASVQLPVIARLFPNARILFARRDPRDVVLSCFRRRFALNPSMYELLTLEGAAAYYDAVMRLSELHRGLLPLPQHVVRYEELVEDFEGTARAACDFIGLDWNQDMLDFAAKARSRGIATPSASQVARGLNREGEGVWRRYREQMAPVLPVLEPWVQLFGYASE